VELNSIGIIQDFIGKIKKLKTILPYLSEMIGIFDNQAHIYYRMNYQKIYDQIIEKAKTRVLEGYKEKHHILPKCLGGDNEKNNLVELTAREHFLVHRLLCEIYPNNNKLWYALWLMIVGKNRQKSLSPYVMSSRTYEKVKLEFINRIKGVSKPSNKGRKVTWGDKISKSLKGKPKPEGFLKDSSKLKNRLINNKPVMQYDKQGNFIKEWNSAKEAERYYNMSNNCINSCLREKTKTSGGYVWKYKN
jgi:hypothetical protein